ncbi:MAG: hypothetical protein PWP61_1107 [Trichococcus sp.]|nr:hypothetical protein [Trichococcus sp.]
MSETQTFLDDFYLVCQPIMLCSNTTMIDCYEILLRSKKTPGFPEETFLWFIQEDARNSEFMNYYHKELADIIALKKDIRLSLNLHPKQLVHASTWTFLDDISYMQSNILIEMTEHYSEFPVDDGLDIIQDYMHQIKEKGFSLAIDDVGSGQNSFALVTRNIHNISTIKFSLLKFGNLNEEVLFNFLKSWLYLSNHYQLKMIVEGIETEQISNRLKKLGMIYQQGYYHGKANILK